MLQRIAEIQGIGLLHDANGKPFTFKKATLIYADNGRGKSTLATILQSLSTGDPTIISGCKTIDGTLPPKVDLQFENGQKAVFENGTWSQHRPELIVFDADFVARNVHSGGSVNTDHRKNLLEFALGASAVSARQAVDKATADSKNASEAVKSLLDQLSGHQQGMSVGDFERLPQIADLDSKLVDFQKREVAANNVAAIQARPVPGVIPEPVFGIDSLFDVLSLSLQDIHEEAEKTVKQHISKLAKQGAEGWLSQGQQFCDGISCPFCGQTISGNDLVTAYQTHFDTSYASLKRKVADLEKEVLTSTSDAVIKDFTKGLAVTIAQTKAWAEQVPIPETPFDEEAAENTLKAFRDFVVAFVGKKQSAPAEVQGTASDRTRAAELWAQFLLPLQATNSAIKEAAILITKYRAQLQGDSVIELQKQIRLHQATKRRYDPEVVTLFTKLSTARSESKDADNAKKAAREKLEELMNATLGRYEKAINVLLTNFGASFTIEGMSANFRGSAPRSEYGILLRGKTVGLEGGPPSFYTVLSESDKRTLAFALFVATTLDDPKLDQRIVVIDDPMCSLDTTRKHHTRNVLKRIYAKAKQMVVLAHDPYFLRDLRDALLKKDKTAQLAILQMVAAPQGYTNFSGFDVDKECESPYARHHRMLYEYSNGTNHDDAAVAEGIRPMLEGYLHRRFPGLLPKDLLFGQVVVLIRDSAPGSPLHHAKILVNELMEINNYAGQFHHIVGSDAGKVMITPSELKTFVDRALNVVHKGTP